MTDNVRYPLVLTTLCVIAAGALAVTYKMTAPRIAWREQQTRDAALQFVCPSGAERFDPVVPSGEEGPVYAAKGADGQIVGYAAIGRHHGYSSDIEVMAGVYPDYRLAAIRVLAAQETPGLGQRVQEIQSARTLWSLFSGGNGNAANPDSAEPWFQRQFRDKTPDHLVVATLAKPGETAHIAAISGATITSNAVNEAVKMAIAKIQLYRDTHETK